VGLAGAVAGAGFGGIYSGASLNLFDSGLHRAQRSEIRDALIARISDALMTSTASRYLRAVRPLPCPLRSDAPEEIKFILDQLQGQAPAVLVALGRKTYDPKGMEIPAVNYRGDIELALYVVCASPRTLQDGRLAADVTASTSTTADPGAEVILEHLEELVLGQELNLKSVYELRPLYEDELITTGDLTIWEQRYVIGVDRMINPDRDVSDVLLDIEAQNNLVDVDADDPDANDDVNPLVDTVSTLEPAP
jgi:hypothetical protein